MKTLALIINNTPIPGPSGLSNVNNVSDPLSKIIQVALIILFIAVILFALFHLIISGIQWITSSGDKQKLQAARSRITYAIIGLIVALLALFIVNLIGGFFGVGLI